LLLAFLFFGVNKEVVGIHVLLTRSLFVCDILRRFLRLASLAKRTSALLGNLLYLSVIHEDARPVGSDVPDPMLHAHNYICNLTWDAEEGRLKAVDLHDVLKRAETIDALFLSELERGLQRLGIGTERTADNRSFEITAVKGKEIWVVSTFS
jgi:hypothetical protein